MSKKVQQVQIMSEEKFYRDSRADHNERFLGILDAETRK